MQVIQQWLEKQSRLEEQRSSLEDVMISHRFGRYAWYRTRYFFLRFVVDQFIHIIEFAFLAFIFSRSVFIGALLGRTIALLLQGWWWGVLEVLREQIREMQAEKKQFLFPRVLAPWLCGSLILTGVGVGLSIVVMLAMLSLGIQIKVFHIYLFSIAIGIALSFFTQTFHSGLYAIQRVYRPLWALVGVDIISFLAIILIWPLLHAWGFVFVMVARAVLSHAVSLRVIWVSYQTAGISSLYPSPLRECRKMVSGVISREGILSGLAAISLRVELLLIVFFLHALRLATSSHNEVLLLYLIAPHFRASHEWAYLFYFDFKRLGLSWYRGWRSLVQNMVFKMSLVMGVIFWLLSAGVAVLFRWEETFGFLLLLLPIFLANALLSFMQISAFAERRFLDLIFSGGALTAGVWIIYQLPKVAYLQILFITFLLFLIIEFIRRQPFGILGRQERGVVLPPTAFMKALWNRRVPVVLGTAVCAQESDDEFLRHVALRLARKLTGMGYVSVFNNHHFVWFLENPTEMEQIKQWLLVEGHGLVEDFRFGAIYGSGREALASQDSIDLLKQVFQAHFDSFLTEPDGHEGGSTFFWRLFPDGILIDTSQAWPPQSASLSARERRLLLHSALRYGETLQPVRTHIGYEVCARIDEDKISVIYGIPSKSSGTVKRNWNTWLRTANLGLLKNPTGKGMSELTCMKFNEEKVS